MTQLRELLARNLGLSRTAAVRLMESGRVVSAAGIAYADRRASVSDDCTSVLVDGEPVALWRTALVLLHKPAGVVTALRDDRHPTAYALLRQAPLFPELRPVGRLDLDTTGLLLWTSEGPLIQRLTHPKRGVRRTYHAALDQRFRDPFCDPGGDLVLEDGYRPTVVELRPLAIDEAHPALRAPPETKMLATITVAGGAYHEVRRIFAALGSHVLALCRIGFGEHVLPPDLPPGAWKLVPTPT